MSMEKKIVTYQNLNEWYSDNLKPIFDEVNVTFATQNAKSNANILFGYWWIVFLKNSMALLEMITGVNYSNQINMTIRLLMEMAADMEFINKNRENITRHKNRFDKLSAKAKHSNGLTYGELAKEGKNFHLFRYNNGYKGEEVNTTTRVKEAYTTDGYLFYEYLSCFTHFNYLGVMYDLDLNQPQNLPNSLRERIHFLQFYPTIFEKELRAIGDLCSIDELKNYNCANVRKVFAELASRCHYDSVRVIPKQTQ